jgi:hypothetical protein
MRCLFGGDGIATVLREYVQRNGIARTFLATSTEYADAVPADLSAEDFRGVPNYWDLDTLEPALIAVPRHVARLALQLLADPRRPGDGWVKT